jgi:hypothetical protein
MTPRQSFRVCAKHGLRLEERPDDTLRCPYGVGHAVTSAFRVEDDAGRQHFAVTDAKEGVMTDLGGKLPMAPPAAVVPEKKKPGKKVLVAARYSDGDTLLLVRVVRVPLPNKPFRVMWETRTAGKKSTSKRAVVDLLDTEQEARVRWQLRCRETLAAGWVEAPSPNMGVGRMPILRAIPAPSPAARKRA